MAKPDRKKLVGAWLSKRVKDDVVRIAAARGISLSEYVRELILKDLDHRIPFGSFSSDQTSKPIERRGDV